MRAFTLFAVVTALIFGVAVVAPSVPWAAARTATPANAAAQFAAAACGDTIALVGTFPAKVTIGARPACVVQVDASAATVSWLWFNSASNFAFTGGTFLGQPYDAMQISASDHLEFAGGHYQGAGSAAFGMLNSSYINIHDNDFAHGGGDAIDVVSSQHVRVVANRFHDLTYGPNHTDLVQVWNQLSGQAADDIVITDNWGICRCQGFDNYGAGDPRPITNVDVERNRVATDMVGGIDFRGVGGASVMKDNYLMTLATQPKGWPGVLAQMTAAPGGTVTQSGNVNGAAP
jgi:hypothetical protein